MIFSCYIKTNLTKIQEEHNNKNEQGIHIGTWQQEGRFKWETFSCFQKSDLLILNHKQSNQSSIKETLKTLFL